MTTAGPLAGLRVVVTRAAEQSTELNDRLTEAGARVQALPLLEIVPPADERPLERAATELALYQWLVLTSANAVDALLERAGGTLPAALRVAVIGERTAAALAAWEITADLVSPRSSAEGLAEALAPRLGRQERVLLPQAADARPFLRQSLSQAGAEVVAVVAYAKRIPIGAAEKAALIFATGDLGWVTFTSPSTANNLATILGHAWEARRAGLRALSIGSITTAALEGLGVNSITEAKSPSADGLVIALVNALA